MRCRAAVTGAAGQLGRQLVRAFLERGDEVLPVARPEWDITRESDLARMATWRPTVVVNAAAWTDVDGCARDPARAMEVNGHAAGMVALAAASVGALALQVSTNEVFPGTLERPYTEADAPDPINPYGASKLLGEELTAAAGGRHLIVRTAWLFGPGGSNFVTKILAAAGRATGAGSPLQVVYDEWGNPTPTPWLADAMVHLAHDASTPDVVHLVGEPPTSRLDWAALIVAGMRPSAPRVEPISRTQFTRLSTPPARAVLACTAGIAPADWRAATMELVAELA